MAQNIEFEDIIMDGMEIKVGRFPLGIDILSWIGHRTEIINIHITWNNDNTTRMLTCRSFNTCTACRKTLDFSATVEFTVVTFVAFNKTKGCLLSHRTNGSGTKGIVFSKDISDVQMGARLVSTRKVQVDIGYFIPLETKESFKWNIVAIFCEPVSTFWTAFLRHIKS